MTSHGTPHFDAARARDVLIVGPEEYVDGRTLSFAKNLITGRYFRLGRRESVILRGALAGAPLDAVSTDYQTVTGRALNEASYQGAIRVFREAGMFATTPDQIPVDERPLLSPPTVFTFDIYKWNPDADLSRVVSFFRWLSAPWAFALVASAIVMAEVLVILDLRPLLTQATAVTPDILPWRVALFLLINGIMFVIHEGAHALTCKAFGGEVREMGFQIRYLIFTPFTRLDDVLLFENRWKRAAVFLAGPLASLFLLPWAYIAWTLLPVGSIGRQTAADLLIWYNLLFLLQLLPFLQFDGYHIVAQFLRMPHLRQDAYTFIFDKLREWFGKGTARPLASDMAGYVKPTYIAYGLSSFVITAVVLIWLIGRLSHRLANWLGPYFGYGLAALLIASMLSRFYLQMKQFGQKAPH